MTTKHEEGTLDPIEQAVLDLMQVQPKGPIITASLTEKPLTFEAAATRLIQTVCSLKEPSPPRCTVCREIATVSDHVQLGEFGEYYCATHSDKADVRALPIAKSSLAERWAAVDKAINFVLEYAQIDSAVARAVMKLLARLAQHRPQSDKPEEEHPAVALLRELEWEGGTQAGIGDGCDPCCPCCKETPPNHDADCKLAALIGKQPKGNDDGNNDDNGTT